jgi:hypothetical protein
MKICGHKIEQVNRLTYLESMVEKNGEIQNEINERIRKASQFYHLIRRTLWTKHKCKTPTCQVYCKKIILYVARTWICTKTQENKMQAIEMTFFRAIMGKAKRDKIRNVHITEKLRMQDIQKQIEKNTSRWYGHVKSMNEHRIPRTVLEMKMTGKRPKGRTRTWWLDQVKTDMEIRV